MNKYSFAILLIFVFNSSCFAQKSIIQCDTLVLDKYVQNVLKIKEKCLQEYMLNRNKISHELLSDRKRLEKLDLWLCNNSDVLIFDTIENQVIEIHLIKGIKKFKPELFTLPFSQESISSTSVQLYNYDKAPFGFTANDTIVNYLKGIEMKIEGKEINIPNNAYEDLLFPNFCHTELSIKPIEAYCSPMKDKIYLYIFGEYRASENISHNLAFQNSYMAKLVIDLKSGYLTRVVMRGHQLCYYNWDNYNFTGF